MKYLSLFVVSFAALFIISNEYSNAQDEVLTTAMHGSKIQYLTSVGMEVSPQQLVGKGDFLYVKTNKKIFQMSLANLEAPKTLREFATYKTDLTFGKIFLYKNSLFIPTNQGSLYELDENLKVKTIHDLKNPNFDASVVFIDDFSKVWIGGNIDKKAHLVSYNLSALGLKEITHWTDYQSSEASNIEAIAEKEDCLLVSMLNNKMISFSKKDLKKNHYLNNSSTTSGLGYGVIINGNHAFWANCAAGLTTIDIANPAKPQIKHILSNTQFRKQHPNAKGTNVCDIAYNKNKNYICVANGWQGVFIADAADPNNVIDYLQFPEFNNHCIETIDNYLYVGNISAGKNGNLKGVKVFKLN